MFDKDTSGRLVCGEQPTQVREVKGTKGGSLEASEDAIWGWGRGGRGMASDLCPDTSTPVLMLPGILSPCRRARPAEGAPPLPLGFPHPHPSHLHPPALGPWNTSS